jgi:hypothetical protein
LARLPEPNTLQPAFMPMARRMGPFTTSSGLAMWVVACTPFRLNRASHSASIAASTTGAYSARQPAITILIASTSQVRLPQRGGTRAIRRAGPPPSAATAAAIFSDVGGTSGKPSEQPRS